MYDIIVVGAGHAGIEACLAGARTGNKTLLITSNFSNAGSMPCNTSIGGPAKGIIVREIDALGGQMGKTTDATYLQMKMLNTAKGPGVQSLRAQADKKAYPRYMQKVLKQQENLDIVEAMVEDLIVEGDECKGVILADGTRYESHTTILTTGTYLKAEVLVGHSKTPSGPDKQKESLYLSSKLKDYGFRIQRLKTGTPPRVEINSIDYSKTTVQPGTDAKLSFSYETTHFTPVEDQTVCYLTYTTAETHKLIIDNLDKCAMFSGLIKGIGPRYCPSIEDKVVKFADKERHQIFLEPESKEMNTIYVQGFSTSMPHDIQEKILAGFTFGSKEKKESTPEMDEFLEKAGITLLRDEYVLIDDSFYLYGRPDYERPGRGIDKRKTPQEITEGMDVSLPVLVIDHEPRELQELADTGVDVDLCGHTHDGQVFPGNIVIRFFWENPCGYLKKGNMHNIVTSGVGLFGPNMRVGTKSEICDVSICFN